MKRFVIIALGAAMIFSVGIGSVSAENSLNSGSMAIGIGFGDSVLNHAISPTDAQAQNPPVDISGRFFVTKDVAITAGFGFQTNSGDVSGTYFGFNFGGRKYLKTNDFAPFVGAQFTYWTIDAKTKNPDNKYIDSSLFELTAMVGAEYFLGKQFSIEGSIGAGVGKASAKIAGKTYDSDYIGTRNFGVRANYYF